ncbi:hypothetical protein [Novosphingobium sp. Fuku2-ISO-50]|uniref:hypothetical protein n=1 Tax=Novosphingobium sp. Fuku2-ISO-50 TaxID=1739114 RepID=UPI000B2387D3|nr:hypothetical protein [Novosphingobium sp. Fuku2-ISO-50]
MQTVPTAIPPCGYMHAAVYTISALVLLTGAGNWVCRQVFSLTGLKDSAVTGGTAAHPAGRIIGWLERSILAIGILSHRWEVLAAVIALKSVARFKDLDDQRFAEYFLVGSLFSVLWAIVITSGWMAYDYRYGIDIRSNVAKMLEASGGQRNG